MILIPILAAADPLQHVLPHYLFEVAGIKVNNQMLMALVAAILMLFIFPTLFSQAHEEAPTGARNFFESILEFLRVEVFRPALKEHTDRFVPFLWTIFFFILFCNLLGQIPFAEIFTLIQGGRVSHLGGTATGTIATTGALALCTFLFIHFSGIVQVARSLMDGTYGHHGHHEEHSAEGKQPHEAAHDLPHARSEGLAADVPADFKAVGNPTKHYGDDEHVGHHHHKPDDGHLHDQHAPSHGMNPVGAIMLSVPIYLWNFAPHPFKPGPGGNPIMYVLDALMWSGLLVLEMVGAVIKPFALMMRLFANMIAGHIVLAALVGLIPITAGVLAQIGVGVPVTLLSLLIRVLELFVAFLQAYIFTFLSTLFIASAVAAGTLMSFAHEQPTPGQFYLSSAPKSSARLRDRRIRAQFPQTREEFSMMDLLAQTAMFADKGLIGIGTGIGAGLICIGSAKGIGHLAGQAMEGIARQPEAGGRIGTNMIIAAALIEGFTFFALVICFLMGGKL